MCFSVKAAWFRDGGFSRAAITAPAPAAPLYSFKAKEGDGEIAFEDSVFEELLRHLICTDLHTSSSEIHSLGGDTSGGGLCVSH